MAGRPKGKENYPEEFESLAVKLLRDNEELTGKELQFQIEKLRPGLSYSLRTFQVIKEKALPQARALKKLDQPWHLGLLNNPEYTINPEAVKRILQLLKWQRSKKIYERITIRQAKWIDRLYAFISDKDDLYSASSIYALHEIDYDISQLNKNKPQFDTSLLDEALSKGINELKDFSISTLDVRKSPEAFLRMSGLFEDGE